ncbi:RDD family protein [Streptomyces sp. NPDC001663]|uniref:RDD family protein n=1 Tax=Streptomyces sp. NPDC001663 TaxID=3364597 RepID=UPI00367B256F
MPKLRRAVAWFIDFALVLTLATGLAVLTFHRISALVTDVPELAARGGLDLLTSRGDVIDASQGLGLSLWDKAVLDVEEAFGVLIVAAFLYQWGCLAFAGRTVGKGLLGLKVTPSAPRRAAVRAAVTTAADIAIYAVACVLLVEGYFVLSVLVWTLAVVVFFLNALPVFSPTRRSLADRVAGTAVTGLGISTPGATPPVRTF